MSDDNMFENDDEDAEEAVAPLYANSSMQSSNNISKKNGGRPTTAPQYAQSTQSGVSSTFGHTTYFDQMESIDKNFQNKYEPKANAFNRI